MTRNRRHVDHRVPIIPLANFLSPYREIPIDKDDPRGSEPLVPLESVGVPYESYYGRTDGNNPPFNIAIDGSRQDMWLRKSFAERLARVNELLRPFEAELFVQDGHRTVACQQGLWNFFYARAQRSFPDGSKEDHRADAMKYIVDPVDFNENDSHTWPAHTNGGAVDLTLQDSVTGELLDMGAKFEEDTEANVADYFERQLEAGLINESDVRLQNRRLLNWAMIQEGLFNETAKVFWHYDWGNQIYVRASRAFLKYPPNAAWYGYIAPPD
jgi:D-alanyl-D-alanine dipeptidase